MVPGYRGGILFNQLNFSSSTPGFNRCLRKFTIIPCDYVPVVMIFCVSLLSPATYSPLLLLPRQVRFTSFTAQYCLLSQHRKLCDNHVIHVMKMAAVEVQLLCEQNLSPVVSLVEFCLLVVRIRTPQYASWDRMAGFQRKGTVSKSSGPSESKCLYIFPFCWYSPLPIPLSNLGELVVHYIDVEQR